MGERRRASLSSDELLADQLTSSTGGRHAQLYLTKVQTARPEARLMALHPVASTIRRKMFRRHLISEEKMRLHCVLVQWLVLDCAEVTLY